MLSRFAFLLVALAACSGPDQRVLFDMPLSQASERASVGSVEVNTVSLPSYAEAAEVLVQSEAGVLEEVGGLIWADDPARAMTGALVRQLSAITKVRAAAEPWPLRDVPEAILSVRVDQLAVLNTGSLVLTGQYAIEYDAEGRRGKLEPFDIAVPVAEATPAGISAAYSASWLQLAEEIARDL